MWREDVFRCLLTLISCYCYPGFMSRVSFSHTGKVTTSECLEHYNDVIMNTVASQITSLTFVFSAVNSDAENIKALRRWPLCGEFTGDR